MKLLTSRDNPQFKAIKRLAQSGRERRHSGQTLLDGVHLIRAYEAARGAVETLVVAESAQAQPEIAGLLVGRNGLVLTDQLYREAAIVDTPSGAMAVISVPPALAPDSSCDSVLLDGVQDPGNVGTLIRTAAAAGFRQVLLSPDCAGAWSPKVLRAGQGAHFALAVVEDVNLPAFIRDYRGQVAVTVLDEAASLYSCDLRSPLAWVFGSEGQGVRRDVAEMASLRIRIPMPGAVESLNVGAAAAVCLFETLRQRLPKT